MRVRKIGFNTHFGSKEFSWLVKVDGCRLLLIMSEMLNWEALKPSERPLATCSRDWLWKQLSNEVNIRLPSMGKLSPRFCGKVFTSRTYWHGTPRPVAIKKKMNDRKHTKAMRGHSQFAQLAAA